MWAPLPPFSFLRASVSQALSACIQPEARGRPRTCVPEAGTRASVQGVTGPRRVHRPGAHPPSCCADTWCSDSDNPDVGFKVTSLPRDFGLKRKYMCSSRGHVHCQQGCPRPRLGGCGATCVVDGEAMRPQGLARLGVLSVLCMVARLPSPTTVTQGLSPHHAGPGETHPSGPRGSARELGWHGCPRLPAAALPVWGWPLCPL